MTTTNESEGPDIAAMDEVLAVLDEFEAREAELREQEEAERAALRTVEHPNGVVVLEDQFWNQGVWRQLDEMWDGNGEVSEKQPRCNTAMCFAGWRAELDSTVKWLVTPRQVYEGRKRLTAASAAKREADKVARESDSQSAAEEAAVKATAEWREARNALGQMIEDLNLLIGADDERATATRNRSLPVETWARDRLGLAQPQADALFTGSNDLRELHIVVDALRHDPEAYIEEGVLDDDEDFEPEEEEDYDGDDL